MANEVEELRKKYVDTVISFKGEDGDNIPFLVSDVRPNPEHPRVAEHATFLGWVGKDGVWNNRGPASLKYKDASLKFPDMGLVNHGIFAVNIERIARRQWRMGYNARVCHPTIYQQRALQRYGVIGIFDHMNVNFLYDLFNRKYPSPDECIRRLTEGEAFSVAFSPQFFLTLTHMSDNILIGYKNWIVGLYKDGEFTLNEKCHHLYESLSQYVPIKAEAA